MEKIEINKFASAGTLESADVQIMIDKNDETGIALELTSSVEKQYGAHIHALIYETLENLSIKNAKVTVSDKGALDCTIKARLITAVYRSAGIKDSFDWEVLEAWNV